jgi:hypothetical protein
MAIIDYLQLMSLWELNKKIVLEATRNSSDY